MITFISTSLNSIKNRFIRIEATNSSLMFSCVICRLYGRFIVTRRRCRQWLDDRQDNFMLATIVLRSWTIKKSTHDKAGVTDILIPAHPRMHPNTQPHVQGLPRSTSWADRRHWQPIIDIFPPGLSGRDVVYTMGCVSKARSCKLCRRSIKTQTGALVRRVRRGDSNNTALRIVTSWPADMSMRHK